MVDKSTDLHIPVIVVVVAAVPANVTPVELTP